ncbi:MAG: putative glycolipid-binding domain-containing protein [Phycisphaerae bacterium]|nr:putative glycolipid-binding domain-containing protein [Gemmatimonadaceae bacterium]
MTHLKYEIHCNASWQTQRASVQGMVGDREVDHRIRRTASGIWTLGHIVQPQLANCTDLDLGFTPATNTIAIRRLGLVMGAFADVRSAWLDVVGDEFSVLEQRYSRESNHLYRYESERFDYQATLRVNDFGLVSEYPGLWEAEPVAGGLLSHEMSSSERTRRA